MVESLRLAVPPLPGNHVCDARLLPVLERRGCWTRCLDTIAHDASLGFTAILLALLGMAEAVWWDSVYMTHVAVQGCTIALWCLFALQWTVVVVRTGGCKLRAWRTLDCAVVVFVLITLIMERQPSSSHTAVAAVWVWLRVALLCCYVALLGVRVQQHHPPCAALMQAGAVVSGHVLDMTHEPDSQVPLQRAHAQAQAHAIAWPPASVDAMPAMPQGGVVVLQGLGSPDGLMPVATMLGVSHALLRQRFSHTLLPRLDTLDGYVTLFCWCPHVACAPTQTRHSYAGLLRPYGSLVERSPILMLLSSEGSVILVGHQCQGHILHDFTQQLERHAQPPPIGATLPRLVLAMLLTVLDEFRKVVESLDATREAAACARSRRNDAHALTCVYQMQAEAARLVRTLQHMRRLVRELWQVNRHRTLSLAREDVVQELVDDMEELEGTADEVQQQLKTLVDMRMSIGGYQMDMIMRVLAVCATLASIPMVLASVFGMNVSGFPDITLGQVAFLSASLMVVAMYGFCVQGWFTVPMMAWGLCPSSSRSCSDRLPQLDKQTRSWWRWRWSCRSAAPAPRRWC
jgi:hypothetical protein